MENKNLIYFGIAAAAIGAFYLIGRKPKKSVEDVDSTTDSKPTKPSLSTQPLATGQAITDVETFNPVKPIRIKNIGRSNAIKINSIGKPQNQDMLAKRLASLSDYEILKDIKTMGCFPKMGGINGMSNTIVLSIYRNEAINRGLVIPQLTCEDINAQTAQTTQATQVFQNDPIPKTDNSFNPIRDIEGGGRDSSYLDINRNQFTAY